MIDSIITVILSINTAFLFLAVSLRLIKDTKHPHAVLSSLTWLRYLRIVFIFSLIVSLIMSILAIHLFEPFFLLFSLACKSTLILLILSIGLFKYTKQIIRLRSLIDQAFYHRKIKGLCLLYCDQVQACSFALFNKFYIVIPICLVEDYQNYRLTLRHEMQHFRQRDGLWQQLLGIIAIICWWNPAYQIYKTQIGYIHEICCDQAVLNKYVISAKEYTATLLKIGHKQNAAKSAKLSISNKPSTFFNRINQLFHQPINLFEQLRSWLRILLISFLLMFSSVWSINAAANGLVKYQSCHLVDVINHISNYFNYQETWY